MIICLFFCTAVSVSAENTLVIREKVIFDLQSYGILQGVENGELETETLQGRNFALLLPE